MRIGIFVETYFPYVSGVSISIESLKDALVQKGHEVYIVTLKIDDYNYDNDPYLILLEGHPYPFKKLKALKLGYTLHYRKNVKELKKFKFDIIHANTEFSVGTIGYKLAKATNVPIVYTYHTLYHTYVHYVANFAISFFKMIIIRRIKNWMKKVDEVIVPSNKVLNIIRDFKVKRDVNVIPTGIKLDRFLNYDLNSIEKIKKNYKLVGKRIMLFAGRLGQEKGIGELIEYFDILSKDFPDLVFLIVGFGAHEGVLKKLVSSKKLEDKIIFTGEVCNSEIGNYYRLCDFFVSASNTETQGLTYFEALASNCVSLVKKDPSLEGIIEDGINGFYFEDKESFLSQAKYILENDMSEIKEKTSEVVKNFSTEVFADRIIKVYEKALKNKKKGCK